jgi:segregation and condensation protein B
MTPPASDEQPSRADPVEPGGAEPVPERLPSGPAWLVEATEPAEAAWVVEDEGTAEAASAGVGLPGPPAAPTGDSAAQGPVGHAERDADANGEGAHAGDSQRPEILDLAAEDESPIGGDADAEAFAWEASGAEVDSPRRGLAERVASEASGADDDGAAAMPSVAEGAGVWPSDEALEAVGLDDTGWTRRNLEAILLVADEPVPATELAELVGARLTEVEGMLVDLAGDYAGQGRGFVLRAVAGGWRLYTHPGAKEVVDAYLRAGQQSRLTRAALETLAVVAYRQPVTRHQVAAVRGVNVDGVFRTLVTRGLIQEVGHEDGPGQAALYATTPAFLEQLGLHGLDQLPPIKDYLPEGVDLMDLQEQM